MQLFCGRCTGRRPRLCRVKELIFIMSKKKIKINYIDFWPGFKKEDNFFSRILDKYYDVEISDNPDYVFCSCFSRKHFKYADCVKIFYTGENIIPDFNLYDYSMGFHYIDFEDRYLRLPHYALYDQCIKAAKEKHTHSDDYYLAKKKFCNYVISNPYAAAERDLMIDALEKYMPVDSGGRYRNNVGGPVADKIEFASHYRFSMAFENSAMSGYTTEKIFDGFAACTIPIYWGSDRIKEEFNPESFVSARDFENFDQVVARVKEIYENDDLYLKMMKAPIAPEGFQAHECLKEDYADAFLRNIFDQDIDKAKRRNMVYVGRDYQKKLKDANKVIEVLDVVKKPMHQFNKTKSQIASKFRKKK